MRCKKKYEVMAIEAAEEGIIRKKYSADVKKTDDGLTLTRLRVKTDADSKALGKRKGVYYTVEAKDGISDDGVCRAVSKELKKILRELTAESLHGKPTVLVAGLGNREIAADSLGARVVERLIVTRNVIESGYSVGRGIANVCGIATGVFAVTGVEAFDLVKGVAERVNATVVIVVDTLATARFERLFTSFQLTDAGLEPGSASRANRTLIDRRSTGIPVIAVGVPLTIYAKSLVSRTLTEANATLSVPQIRDVATKVLGEKNLSVLLAPKEVDEGVLTAARIIADGINLAFHNSTDKKYYSRF
jgi:Germination protease.